ncbi:MAG: carboxypeptidase regulatory-like domain-containing protein [Nitrosopumilus sp.]|nr:carboxypeptidase regulatory-like domain-containing protein [Nitrosopumilus sp.]
MLKNKAVIVFLFSIMMLSSFIPHSEAKLWELVIDLNVEKGSIHSGESVIITGKVVDHSYKPIRGAEVLIRSGSDTTKTFTDPWGVFRGEFKDFHRTPGTYTVNVVASWYGMTGLTSTQFQVKGEISQITVLQEKLNTEQAIRYLGADEKDFLKDPIGQTLFKYYHGLLNNLVLEQKEDRERNPDQTYVEQQRKISNALREQAIVEFNPHPGTYGGYQYEDYINNVNPEIRELIGSQLNFTKNNFEQAQTIRDQILANGGTYEEARAAYLSLLTISKETLEEFNQKMINEKNEKISKENQTDVSSENQ